MRLRRERRTPAARSRRTTTPAADRRVRLAAYGYASTRRAGAAGAETREQQGASDDLVDLLQRASAGELEKHRRQVIVDAAGLLAELVDRPTGDDSAPEDNADPIAHLLRNFQC